MKKEKMSISRISFVLVFAVFLVAGSAYNGVVYAHKAEVIVETQYGVVEGFIDENDTIAWKKIPYAKPPTVENGLRWIAPVDPDPWDGILKANQDCEPCSQMGVDPLTYVPYGPTGIEDCLYINIWRPNTHKKNLPVYVWIHGGSNNYGSISGYNGSVLASKSDMVVVHIQYRLGPLGWFRHPVETGDPLTDSGNFGTLDTLKALEWIQENIKAFGGNKNNVLISGESAGAHNVMNLVISPLAKKLFHKALSQSGGMSTGTTEYGDQRAQGIIANLLLLDPVNTEIPDMDGDTDLDDDDVTLYLNSKTNADVVNAYWLSGSPDSSSAYQDGTVIPEGGVIATIESGNYNKVPIILGSNQDETKFFLPLYGPAFKGYGVPSSAYTWGDLFWVLYPPYPLTIDDVLPFQFDKDLYSICAKYGSLNWRASFVDSIARPLKEQQEMVYAYLFKWDGADGSDYNFILGAAHATEIPFFHGGDTDIYEGIAFSPSNDTPGRQALGDAMMAYVAKFVRTNNPNVKGLPKWNRWSNEEGEPKVIVFDATENDIAIEMIQEEVTLPDIQAELTGVISTWNETYNLVPSEDPLYVDYEASFGWLPWYFVW